MDQCGEEGGRPDQLQGLMALLAGVSSEMITIADEVRKKPAVGEARRGCDLREYRDAFRFEDRAVYAFETYVEADMLDGSLVCWLVDVDWTPVGWELHRTFSRRDDSGEDDIMTFPDVSADRFVEFVNRVSDAMRAFVESARSYHPD
jgi:hypothetical protein